jgi:anthranilate phosphoribosyltransferase
VFSPEEFFKKLKVLDDEQLWDLLLSWHGKETASEIGAFCEYIEEKSPQRDSSMALFDCAGTGGDKSNTFNISTCSAIVAAASGQKIAKNGGRSSTSQTGSVDVLEALGVKLDLSENRKLELLREFNLGFFSSKISGELLSRVKQLSRYHKKSTFLSLLGPLLSPFRLEAQIIGVAKKEWFELLRRVFENLVKKSRRKRAVLIHSFSETFCLDELSTATESWLLDISESGIKEFFLKPEDFGVPRSPLEALLGTDANGNAEIIKKILSNRSTEGKVNTVLMNSALLMYLSERNIPKNQTEFLLKIKDIFEKSKGLIENNKALKNFTVFLKSNII